VNQHDRWSILRAGQRQVRSYSVGVDELVPDTGQIQRNVRRWQDGDMRKRWTAAGMLQAEQQFRRITGYSDLAKLVIAIEQRHLLLQSQTGTTPTPVSPLPSDPQPSRTITELPRRSGQPPAALTREGSRAAGVWMRSRLRLRAAKNMVAGPCGSPDDPRSLSGCLVVLATSLLTNRRRDGRAA
jgi:hypothetical protein